MELDEATKRVLLERAAHLDWRDESLVRLAMARGHTYRSLARMYDASAGATFRRVRSLLRRLGDSVVVALIESPAGGLPPTYREIGLRHFVRRQAVRGIARELGVSRAQVHRANAYVREWVRARQQARAAVERAMVMAEG